MLLVRRGRGGSGGRREGHADPGRAMLPCCKASGSEAAGGWGGVGWAGVAWGGVGLGDTRWSPGQARAARLWRGVAVMRQPRPALGRGVRGACGAPPPGNSQCGAWSGGHAQAGGEGALVGGGARVGGADGGPRGGGRQGAPHAHKWIRHAPGGFCLGSPPRRAAADWQPLGARAGQAVGRPATQS